MPELLRIHELAAGGGTLTEILGCVHDAVSAVNDELAEYVGRVIAEVQAFIEHDAEFSLEQLLSHLSLGSGAGAPTEGGGVKVASLHRTKGLQWPVVYIVGMEEDAFPDYRNNKGDQLHQERRLCFVGVCRAEDELIFTRVEEWRGHSKEPSRFLKEMGI